MQGRSAAFVAACLLFGPLHPCCAAGQTNDLDQASEQATRTRSHDGWRPVRRSATDRQAIPNSAHPDAQIHFRIANQTVGRTRIAAQGPEENLELDSPAGPTWSYPSRRTPASVPVPAYDGEVDAARLQLALNSARRSSGRTRPNPAPRAMYQYQSDDYSPQNSGTSQDQSPEYGTPQYQAPGYRTPVGEPAYESVPPSLPAFHPTPFNGQPDYGRSGNRCEPCEPAPFEDACADLYQGYRYTWDSIYFFALFDAVRMDHESTRAGGRFGLNWGLPVIDDDSGLGFQFGLSGSALEEGSQTFASSGLFYRGDMRAGSAWNAGAVFDWMYDEEISSRIGQVRGMASVTVNPNNEFGVWGAGSAIDDDDKRGHKAESVNQINLFYRYLFNSGTDVSAWAGWRSEPESAAVGGSWYTPINDYWAGVVGGYYAFQGDTWNVYSGLVRHWGNRARQDYIGQDRHLPYLPVADNGTMTLFHKR